MANPAIIDQIAPEDIESCVFLETQCRRQLYPSDQLKEVEDFFRLLTDRIREDFGKRDIFSLPGDMDRLISYIRILPETEFVSDFIEEANRNRARLDHILRNTVYVIGDSHVNFFSGNENLSFIPIGNDINTCRQVVDLPFTVFHLGPCLAYNSNKYGTKSRFLEKLDYLLSEIIEDGARIMFTMGEIDIRAHVFKETEKQGCGYQPVVDMILTNYADMMKSVRNKGYKVYCFAPVASQSDSVPADEKIFTRFGSETERNEATAYFVKRLQEILEQENIPFLSVFESMVSGDYRTKHELLCPDRCHLGQAALPLARKAFERAGLIG